MMQVIQGKACIVFLVMQLAAQSLTPPITRVLLPLQVLGQ